MFMEEGGEGISVIRTDDFIKDVGMGVDEWVEGRVAYH